MGNDKIYKVKCNNPSNYVVTTDASLFTLGKNVACPDNCSKCLRKGKFLIRRIFDINSSEVDENAIFYTEQDRIAILQDAVAASNSQQNIPTAGQILQRNTPSVVASSNSQQQSSAHNVVAVDTTSTVPTATVSPEQSNANSSASSRYGNQFSVVSNTGSSGAVASSCMYLKPTQTNMKVSIAGVEVTAKNECKSLLNKILLHWRVAEMFGYDSATVIKDEFVYLMYKALDGKVLVQDVADILNNPYYTVDQKFFYIYYKIIYRHDRTVGFCYKGCTGSSIFTSRNDFVKKFVQKDMIVNFYVEHKAEVLYYLNVSSEDELLDFIPLEYSRLSDCREIVLINRSGNSFKVTKAGSVRDFIYDWKNLSDCTYVRKQVMVEVLKKYRFTSRGDMVLREIDEPFVLMQCANVEDSVMRLGILNAPSSYATEFNMYLSLLREYCLCYRPESLVINNMTFTNVDFSRQIENVVGLHCANLLGGKEEEAAKGLAYFVQIVYQNNIFNFVLENRGHLDDCLSLLVDENSEFDVDKYFRVFSNCMICSGGNLISMQQYMRDRLGNRDIDYIFGVLSGGDIIPKYITSRLSRHIGNEAFAGDIEKMANLYQQQYDGWIANN